MPLTDLWQIDTAVWQPAFIRENLLSLGHETWQGYLTQGRGLVVCEVEEVEGLNVAARIWCRDLVRYRIQYRPIAAIRPYLTAGGLPADVVDRLLAVAHTYAPERESDVASSSSISTALAAFSPPSVPLLSRWLWANPLCPGRNFIFTV